MNVKFAIAIATMILPVLCFSQNGEVTDTLQSPGELAEVIVYANKFPEHNRYVAQQVTVITNKTALNLQPNSADVLINSGALFVQKSQQGGGSPVIRGFEASRVLLMVDGIRMNNAIYRAGHLQNIITVDNMILDRMEVLYGPSSTLYGSDALGGVVNMFTRNPSLTSKSKTEISGSASLRYATAINEQRGNIILNIGGRKFASLTSVTYGSFGDIIQGSNRSDKYPSFGSRPVYVQRFGNKDSLVANPDPDKQISSGYDQVDVTQKFLFQPNKNIQHILNLQFSNTSDVTRYDRLTDGADGNLDYAEWYYGPQLRNMAAYHFNAVQVNGFFQNIKAAISYQDIKESRITRRFSSDNKDFRWEHVNVFGASIDLKHYDKKNELHAGAESYTNFVRSTAERRNISTGAVSRIRTRYSDGPTSQATNAVFVQHAYFINEHLTLNDGLRFNLVNLNAVFADTSIMSFPFKEAKQNNFAVTGNLGLVYSTEKTRAALAFSSGFRSPNVDDMSKVFESGSGIIIVPNADLEPEYTYNGELNVNHTGSKFWCGGSVVYTLFRNAIVLDAFTYNGQSAIDIDGISSTVQALQNKAKAYLYGFSANAGYTIAKNTSLDGVVTYTYGRFTGADGAKVPLDHIPPVYGRMGVKHTETKWNAEFFTLFNGWKRSKNYNPFGEDNEQYATADGMPSWLTLNLRGAVNVGKNVTAQLMIENILDRNYRYFASGISAPGRNFAISIKTSL